jgi:hypothetical protein
MAVIGWPGRRSNAVGVGVPGPGQLESDTGQGESASFDDATRLVIMSVPDDGVVRGTRGRPLVTVAQLVVETLSARGVAALIEGLTARGSLTAPPRTMRTPSSLLSAESAIGDTIATWGLAMDADRWLHETFELRKPDSMGPLWVTLPGGRQLVYPELSHSATEEGRRDWTRIRNGLGVSTRGRRGQVTDPDDPFGGYDYAAADEDD